MLFQKEIKLPAFQQGFHLITYKILKELDEIKNIKIGFLQVLMKHISTSLTIKENFEPTVRGDFERHFNVLFPERAT